MSTSWVNVRTGQNKSNPLISLDAASAHLYHSVPLTHQPSLTSVHCYICEDFRHVFWVSTLGWGWGGLIVMVRVRSWGMNSASLGQSMILLSFSASVYHACVASLVQKVRRLQILLSCLGQYVHLRVLKRRYHTIYLTSCWHDTSASGEWSTRKWSVCS